MCICYSIIPQEVGCLLSTNYFSSAVTPIVPSKAQNSALPIQPSYKMIAIRSHSRGLASLPWIYT